MSSPDADLQRHELKAEAEAEWTLEEKIRPKRPGPVAPRRPVDGGCGFPWGVEGYFRGRDRIWISHDKSVTSV